MYYLISIQSHPFKEMQGKKKQQSRGFVAVG
jgi:hypothetical protein